MKEREKANQNPQQQQKNWVAGVDEAGRGPLAGPVIAAAVILNPLKPIKGLADSKILKEESRQALFLAIRQHALCVGVARATVSEIDSHNILQASLLAMQRAVSKLKLKPERILVDGNHCPNFDCDAEAVVGGDAKVDAISAASIIAKVVRDRIMIMLDQYYPGYDFGKHKGYGTPSHLTALNALGPSRIHRRTFMPVIQSLQMDLFS